MESGETYIKNLCGKECHFSVPSGYFNDFSERIVGQLPQMETKVVKLSLWQRYRSAIVAAACVCIIAMSGAVYMATESHHNDIASGKNALQGTSSYNSEDCVADYSMLDNEDIYALVSNY